MALSVPASLKLKDDEPKYILKKSLERILPDDILYRKKMGFCVPLREWAGELMIDYIDRNLKTFCDDHPQFNRSELEDLLDRLRTGDETSVNRLWTLYFLIAWFRKWMD
jgi:asparagine synthase (glutamine-hydrolysing)